MREIVFALPIASKNDTLAMDVGEVAKMDEKSIEEKLVLEPSNAYIEEHSITTPDAEEPKSDNHKLKESFMEADRNDLGGFDEKDFHFIDEEGGSEEPEVKKVKREVKDGSKETLLEKLKALPLWVKGVALLLIVFLYMLKDEMSSATPKDVVVSSEVNVSAPQQVQEAPVADKPREEQKIEKLKACMLASPLSFKYEGGKVVPIFSGQVIPESGTFCEDFTLKNYRLDGANNSLSVVAEVYSGDTMVQKLSLDPLAYFKPSYYKEGIGLTQPNGGGEAVYMPGDVILASQNMSLKLVAAKPDGNNFVYSLLLNGEPTAITVSAQYVQ